jgi:poly(beta-D-mannuronate) lyase
MRQSMRPVGAGSLTCAIFAVLALVPGTLFAATRHVHNAEELLALPPLAAGDVVVVHDGVYKDVDKEIAGQGTAERPVTVHAESSGGVAFGGASSIVISGDYVTFAGFRFDGETAAGGAAQKGGVLQLKKGSRHCRVTNCMFRNFNKSQWTDLKWLVVEGYDHVVEYCSFEGKSTAGPTIAFVTSEGAETQALPRHHVFRANYMGPRTEIGENGYEGIRIGLSGLQEYNSASTFEANYFYRTIYFPEGGNGEQEVISNKSSGNIYRYNTFRDMKGELSLRHGDDCVVEHNFFFQKDTPRAGGVRIIGERHVVRDNYFDGVGGEALIVYNGDKDWPATDISTGHEAGDSAKVLNNTFVDCKSAIHVGGGGTKNRRPPIGVEVRNNLVQRGPDGEAIRVDQDPAEVAMSGNVASAGERAPELPGLVYVTTPAAVRDAAGIAHPAKGVEAGARDVEAADAPHLPVGRADVGPSYYEGPPHTFTPPVEAAAAPTGRKPRVR